MCTLEIDGIRHRGYLKKIWSTVLSPQLQSRGKLLDVSGLEFCYTLDALSKAILTTTAIYSKNIFYEKHHCMLNAVALLTK